MLSESPPSLQTLCLFLLDQVQIWYVPQEGMWGPHMLIPPWEYLLISTVVHRQVWRLRYLLAELHRSVWILEVGPLGEVNGE